MIRFRILICLNLSLVSMACEAQQEPHFIKDNRKMLLVSSCAGATAMTLLRNYLVNGDPTQATKLLLFSWEPYFGALCGMGIYATFKFKRQLNQLYESLLDDLEESLLREYRGESVDLGLHRRAQFRKDK